MATDPLTKLGRALWLAPLLACLLAASNCRAAGRNQADARTLEAARFLDSLGPLCVVFPRDSDAPTARDNGDRAEETQARAAPEPELQFLGKLLGELESAQLETERQRSSSAGQAAQAATSLPPQGGQFLSPRAQLTSKELLRRRRINELLDALADDIPKQRKQALEQPASKRVAASTVEQERTTRTIASEAPIYRSGRTFPSVGGFRSAGEPSLAIGWPESVRSVNGAGGLGGARESRKTSAFAANGGIVWVPAPDGQPAVQRVGPGASTIPPFFSQHSTNAVVASNKSARTRANPDQLARQQQQHGQLAPALLNSLDGGPSERHQQHSRSGSEEVALHTPLHSGSSSDYEWKRVENSRNSWNNLRGMWGKRSPPPTQASTIDGELQGAEGARVEPFRGLLMLGAPDGARDDGGAGRQLPEERL